jgi:activator of HSP90 ATPase
MALPPTTANWHWKNKNVTGWGKLWFERELVKLTVKGDDHGEVSISKVVEVDGDVELGQRKSKLITIYDCKVELEWKGIASDGTEAKGKLTIPEVSHEITLDGLSEYAYAWSLKTDSSPAVDALYALAKARLPTALETKFAEFPSALIEAHGKDLTISAEPSRSGTPSLPNATVPPVISAATQSAAAPKPTVQQKKKPINTSDVKVEATFMAAADDLFSLLTDEKRIPMWTRAEAKSVPIAGQEFSLFDGGVRGKYVLLSPPKEFVQEWALKSPTWPSDHSATLTTTLEQSTDSTKVTFNLAGVPKGLEDEIKRNLEGYYIQGLKSIGYVQLIQSPQSYSIPRTVPPQSTPRHDPKTSDRQYVAALVIASLVLVAAFSIPFLSSPSTPAK